MKAMKYFDPMPKTCEGLKKMYRSLAVKHHPDRGGDTEAMKAVNNEYDELWPRLKDIHVNRDGETYTKQNAETPEAFKSVIAMLIRFEGIDIEICGTFIWVSGDTRPYKDTIKGLGFRWHAKKASWYLAPDGYRKRSRKSYSMDDIRAMYGSQEVEGKPAGKIA